MATTPNFNWSTPDNTGLVKNGALDIRTLGNSIDASLVDLKGGTTGQVLSKATGTDMDFTWITPSAGGGGKVLQVVNATTNTVVTNSTSTYADTTLTATITPSSSSSKILVIALLNVQKGDANVYVQTRLVRNSTAILNVATQTGFNNSTAIQNVGTDGVTYLDSPATTSATTYKMQIASATNAASVTAQGGSSTSSITLMEIGA